MAEVLAPLCSENLSARDLRGKELLDLVWAHLTVRGFRLFLCNTRGCGDEEELVVILPQGIVSWPTRRLVPEAAPYLEVEAL